jgi:ribosomal protein S27E
MPDDDNDEIGFVLCPRCGHEQPDMGNNVKCEECGELMPTADEGGAD